MMTRNNLSSREHTVRDVRDFLSNAFAQAEEFNLRHFEGDTLTPEDAAAWKRCLDDVDAATAELERRGHPVGRLSGIDESRAALIGRGLGNGSGADYVGNPLERDAFVTYLRTGEEGELRAMGVTPSATGGYTVPEGFRRRVTDTMRAFGGLRRLAEVIVTDSGEDLPWPTSDDTGNAGTILDENTPMSEVDASFGTHALSAFMYVSGMVRVSYQLSNDTGIDLEAWLADRLGRRIGRAQAAHWINGNGISEPQGLIAGTTVGRFAQGGPNGAPVGYDDLVDLVHSVDVAYREGAERAGDARNSAGVGWLMSDLTLSVLRKLVDGHGRPLIEPDVKGAAPNSLLGYPIVVDNDMPVIEDGSTPIAFGNFRAGYVIRDVRAVQVARLVERYADHLQLGFMGWHRADGCVQDVNAVKLLQIGNESS